MIVHISKVSHFEFRTIRREWVEWKREEYGGLGEGIDRQWAAEWRGMLEGFETLLTFFGYKNGPFVITLWAPWNWLDTISRLLSCIPVLSLYIIVVTVAAKRCCACVCYCWNGHATVHRFNWLAIYDGMRKILISRDYLVLIVEV